MDTSFWLRKWENNDLGFHKSEANPALVKHFSGLGLTQGSRIFLPLCGKTLDIAWLLAKGYRVAGAELVELAIEQLFAELQVEPEIAAVSREVKRYSATDIDIFVGDIFNVSCEMLGSIAAIYDRAALVALPAEVRDRYTAHLMQITDRAPQLIVSYEYDPGLMAGPPFSISREEVSRHYGDRYDLTLAASTNIPGGLKGKCAATENVWLLRNP